MNMAFAAAALNEIRINTIRLLESDQTDSMNGAHKSMRLVCKEFASMLLCDNVAQYAPHGVNATLKKLNCNPAEKEVFLEIEREMLNVFLRLSEIKIEELTTEDLLHEGLILTKASMLCHVLWIDSLVLEFQRTGFAQLREKSREGLWLHTLWTCVRVATQRIHELKGKEKEMKRKRDAEVLVAKIEEIVRSLVNGIGSMVDLVHDIGEDMTPFKPAGLDEIFRFGERAMSMAEFLRKDWNGLAPYENNQREDLRLWLAELSVSLVRLCPHPMPVPRVGCWYEYNA